MFKFKLFAMVYALMSVVIGVPESGLADSTGMEVRSNPAKRIVTSEGQIHILPSLSAPSVKNGGILTISAVVTAQAGVSDVIAVICPDIGENDTGIELDRIDLKPASANLGGVRADGTTGLWEAQWHAQGLAEGYYRVNIVVTDRNGNTRIDRALRFSDPISGNNVPGTSTYSHGGMQLLGATDTFYSETGLRCSFIDTLNGYAYFAGYYSGRSALVKVELGDGSTPPRRVGASYLNFMNPMCAGIDVEHGFAYLGLMGYQGWVVKIDLGEGSSLPTLVGSLILNTGESDPSSAVIDPDNGFAYFGTYTSPGRVVKVALGDGWDLPTRVGAVTLETGEDEIVSAVIDPENGYAYFGTATTPGRVVKVALGEGSNPPERIGSCVLNSGEDNLYCAVIDLDNGYAYFGTWTSPGQVVKVSLGNGSDPPVRTGSVGLNPGENHLLSGMIDPANEHAYFGTYSTGEIIKIALGAGPADPQRVNSVALNQGSFNLAAGVIDTEKEIMCLGYNGGFGSSKVVSISTTDGSSPPEYIGEDYFLHEPFSSSCSVIDPDNGFAYFGSSSGVFTKVALESGTTQPYRVRDIQLSVVGEGISCMMIDPDNGYAYFGTTSSPARVVKVALGDGADQPELVSYLILNTGEDNIGCGVIDLDNRYAYFGTSPGIVVKVALGEGPNPPERIGALTLDTDEIDLAQAVIDPDNGFVYFGSNYATRKVIKVDVGEGASLPTRIGAVPMVDEFGIHECSFIDTANGFAYFCSNYYICKIVLGNGSEPPQLASYLHLSYKVVSAVIDLVEGCLFTIVDESASVGVNKIALGSGAPLLIDTYFHEWGPDGIIFASAVYDQQNRRIYFNATDQWGQQRVGWLGLSQHHLIKGTRLTMPENGTVMNTSFYSHADSGHVRLALFDTSANPHRLWQSGPIEITGTDEGWLTENIENGTPPYLYLEAGDYWLAWQVDSPAPIPSYVQGTSGDGFFVPAPWGDFPEILDSAGTTGITLTDEIWSTYIEYDNVSTPMPTATPVEPLPVPSTTGSGMIVLIFVITGLIVVTWKRR